MSDREPTRDELLAMAYVDGELSAEERAAFEERLRAEPELLAEVGELQRLDVIARQVTPREPKDLAWERLARVHGQGTDVGLFLSLVGVVGVLGWTTWKIVASDLEAVPKLSLCLLVLGLLALFFVMLRARLRTLPYDPYTDVER